MSKWGFLVVFVLFCIICGVFSQTDSSFILPELKIYYEKNNEIAVREFVKYDFFKFFLEDEYLRANPKYYDFRINISDINKVSIRSGVHGERGALIGAGIGFICGFWLSGVYDSHFFKYGRAFLGGLVTAVPIGLIGGLIGLFINKYDTYYVYKVPNDKKRKYLEKILKRYDVMLNPEIK